MAPKTQQKKSSGSGGSIKRKTTNPTQKSEGQVSNFKKPKLSSNPNKSKFNPTNASQPSKFPKKEYQKPHGEKGEVGDSKKQARLRSKVPPFSMFLAFVLLWSLWILEAWFCRYSMEKFRCFLLILWLLTFCYISHVSPGVGSSKEEDQEEALHSGTSISVTLYLSFNVPLLFYVAFLLVYLSEVNIFFLS